MTAHLDPAIVSKLIEYFPEYKVLYCHPCTQVYFPYQLDRHLAQTHNLAKADRQPVVEYCQTLPVVLAADVLALGRDYSSPVPFLPILKGFACSVCRFYSQNRDIVRAHLNKTHRLFRHECVIRIRPVQLQSWHREKRAKYWPVQASPATATATPAAAAVAAAVDETRANMLDLLEQEEARRLEQLDQDHLIADAEVEIEDSTPWLNGYDYYGDFFARHSRRFILPTTLC